MLRERTGKGSPPNPRSGPNAEAIHDSGKAGRDERGWRDRWWTGPLCGSLALALAVLVAAHFTTKKMLTPTRASAASGSAKTENNSGALRLMGKTEAVEARAILAPLLAEQQMGTLTVTWLAPSGKRVQEGDVLAEFDRAAQLRDFIDKQAEASDENDKVEEAQAKEIADRAKDETELLQAEDALSKAKLEMGKADILSRIDAEKASEDLDEAQATVTQLKETFNLKRKAAQAAIRILEIQRDRTRETMLHAQTNAALMQIRSPIAGVVVYNTIWKQGNMGEVQEGDQVQPGVPFMQVVNPAAMEVVAKVNQEDLLRLTVGQPVRVYLDAYPDLMFQGRLESIDPMVQAGVFSGQPRAFSVRTFSATVSIQGNNPRLMPDLSAAVEIGGGESGASAQQ